MDQQSEFDRALALMFVRLKLPLHHIEDPFFRKSFIQGEKGTFFAFHSLFVLKMIKSLNGMNELQYCDPLKEALLDGVRMR